MSAVLHPQIVKSIPPTQVTREIATALRAADLRLLKAHPWLGRDDFMASLFFLAALTVIGSSAMLWADGVLPTLATIVVIMLAQSVLHELEHDLIHDLYVSQPFARGAMFSVIWVVKASIDPWVRGRWHRWHHAVSGQEEDIEERLIGMGLPWGPFRLLITLFPAAAIVIKPSLHRAVSKRVAEGIRRPNFRHPRSTAWFFHLVTGFLVTLPLLAIAGWWMGASWAWPLAVLWVLPNTIRHACIVFLSSNSHYTGIRRGVVLEQNQILDHPIFWPLQAVSWNFGATHVVHHFLVRQPFWRRTLIFSGVRQMLIDHGVPANDLSSIVDRNRRSA